MTTVVELGGVADGDTLLLPWCDEAPLVDVRYEGLAPAAIVRGFRLARGRVDRWRRIPLDGVRGPVRLSSPSPVIAAARLAPRADLPAGAVPGPVLPLGERYELVDGPGSARTPEVWLACDLLGDGVRRDLVRLTSPDRLNWQVGAVVFDAVGPEASGTVLPAVPTAEGALVCLLGTAANPPLETLRVWERRVAVAGGLAEVPLRFRVVPRIWPEIALVAADGTSGDVTAPAHELRLRCEPGERGSVRLDVAGISLSLIGRSLEACGRRIEIPGSGQVSLVLHLQDGRAALTVDGLDPVLLVAFRHTGQVPVVAVTTNVADFSVGSRAPSTGQIWLDGDAVLYEATVYGLREPITRLYRTALARTAPGPTLYSSSAFTVHAHQVTEGGDLPALVPDRATIVSPIRVVEEFAWRETPYGDMTRVVGRGELWRSRVEPGRFPSLRSAFATVDASFQLAMETFQRNSSAEFALPGQAGLWSAGYFQGSGLGFGSWRRDTAHVALRCGSLLDPRVARASLAHVADEGFDNGSDGDSLPAVAVWDHVLATGDETLVHQTWPQLARTAVALDTRFDEHRGLVLAPQATSNDCFDEPEAGGFALSTEIYSMQSYAALARMARLPGIDDPRAGGWQARALTMRRAIIEQFWSPEHGFFTSGPRGSEAYARGYWETSGAEAALWGFLGTDVEPRIPGVLRRLRAAAMSDYGVVLFPYKEADNHFCGSVWYGWQAGIARAAARVGDAALVRQLIAQQVRTVVRNKTFYEVTDAATGESWRWPGQLWHAAGFVSLVLYGLLGIAYDSAGMVFTPAVSPEFDGARLSGLTYRRASLDVEVRGHGSRCRVLLDGRLVTRIPADTAGPHTVVLELQ